jgi:peptide/nickel transport system substrate-binding protein
MRKYLYTCIVLALAALLGGCGGSGGRGRSVAASTQEASSKTYSELHWGTETFPGVLDWNRNVWWQMVTVESLAINNLMEFEPDGKVKPGLASSVQQPNPTTYIYHLRSVKFSDGNPMTSADVVYSLDRNRYAKESWAKSYWEGVSSISAPSSSTVVVKLKKPNAVFEDIVAFTGEIIEKAAAEKVSEKELGTPGHLLIGTGPWKFDSYQPEVSVHLSRNPYWSGPRQPAERITVNLFKTEASMALALRSGAVDGISFIIGPKTFAGIPGVRMMTAPAATMNVASANTATAPFNDVHVRRAIAYATNVKGIIDALYPPGTGSEEPTIIPSDFFASLGSSSEVEKTLGALPKYEFNIAKAKQELAKSAYPHGFTTEIDVEQVEAPSVATAQILALDLAKIGITANVREVPVADVPSVMFSGKSKLVVDTYGGVYPDPEDILSSAVSPSQIAPPGSGLNIANYRNPEAARLQRESVETLNPKRRLQLIGRLMRIVNEEAPYWQLGTHEAFAILSEKYVMVPKYSWWTTLFTPWGLNVKLAG